MVRQAFISEVSDDALEVVLHALGGGDDGLQPRVGGPEIPLREEFAGVRFVNVAPEVAKVFLDGVTFGLPRRQTDMWWPLTMGKTIYTFGMPTVPKLRRHEFPLPRL